ncbi:hypothetical protein BKA81DRAFT_176508 [Phyllosticta paracitricarpa]
MAVEVPPALIVSRLKTFWKQFFQLTIAQKHAILEAILNLNFDVKDEKGHSFFDFFASLLVRRRLSVSDVFLSSSANWSVVLPYLTFRSTNAQRPQRRLQQVRQRSLPQSCGTAFLDGTSRPHHGRIHRCFILLCSRCTAEGLLGIAGTSLSRRLQ